MTHRKQRRDMEAQEKMSSKVTEEAGEIRGLMCPKAMKEKGRTERERRVGGKVIIGMRSGGRNERVQTVGGRRRMQFTRLLCIIQSEVLEMQRGTSTQTCRG